MIIKTYFLSFMKQEINHYGNQTMKIFYAVNDIKLVPMKTDRQYKIIIK